MGDYWISFLEFKAKGLVFIEKISYIKIKVMAKRLTREEKREQAIEDLINEMFRIAGHSVTFDDIKDRKDNWFQEYTMTEEQRDEWKKWGKKYLRKKLDIYAARAEKEMEWVGLMWGLKIKLNQDAK